MVTTMTRRMLRFSWCELLVRLRLQRAGRACSENIDAAWAQVREPAAAPERPDPEPRRGDLRATPPTSEGSSRRSPNARARSSAPERATSRSRPPNSFRAPSAGCSRSRSTTRISRPTRSSTRLSDELAGTENRIAVERMRLQRCRAGLQHVPQELPDGALCRLARLQGGEVLRGARPRRSRSRRSTSADSLGSSGPCACSSSAPAPSEGTSAPGSPRAGTTSPWSRAARTWQRCSATASPVQLPDGDAAACHASGRSQDPAEAPPADLVLVCVKSYDTRRPPRRCARRSAPRRSCCRSRTASRTRTSWPTSSACRRLLVGLTFIGIELIAPGVVHYTGRGEILFGEPDGARARARAALADVFAAAGVSAPAATRHPGVAWEKLAWNAGFNAVTTLTGSTVGEALADAGSRELIVGTMIETRRGRDRPRHPGAPASPRTRRWRNSSAELPDFATSMLQDLRRGRRLEHDAMNGAVVRAAARAGVAAPLNRMLLGLLGRLDPET